MNDFESARRQAEQLTDGPRTGNLKPAGLGHTAKAQAEVGEDKAALAWIDARRRPWIRRGRYGAWRRGWPDGSRLLLHARSQPTTTL